MNELEYLVKLKTIINYIGYLKINLETISVKGELSPRINLNVLLEQTIEDTKLIYGVKQFGGFDFRDQHNTRAWVDDFVQDFLYRRRIINGYLTNESGLFRNTNQHFLSLFSKDLSLLNYESVVFNFELFLGYIFFDIIKELKQRSITRDYIFSLISQNPSKDNYPSDDDFILLEWENGKLTYLKSN